MFASDFILFGAILSVASALLYVLTSLAVADRFTLARRIEPGPTPADFGLDYKPVRLNSRGDGIDLAAWYLAAEGTPRGAVVFVHGRNTGKGHELNPQAMDLVALLRREGLSVLMLDLRGHGESAPARLTYGCNERRDVLGAVDWLLARGYPHGAIAVFGASMGGSAAIAAAAEEPAIGAVISDSAFADFGDVLRLNFARMFRSRIALVLLPGALCAVTAATGARLGSFRPEELAAQRRSLPMLLIHSSGDPLIPPDHALRLAEAAGIDAWITPAQGHVESFVHDPQAYRERVRAFLLQHVGQGDQPREQGLASVRALVPAPCRNACIASDRIA